MELSSRPAGPADPGFAGHAGLTLRAGQGGGPHVWLHAADRAAHEFHAGEGFDAVMAAVTATRGVAVSTLLTRSNARVLAALPGWLHAHGVGAWRIVVPRVVGEVPHGARSLRIAGVGALDGLLPRLSVALPYALHALAAARRLGLQVAIAGAPDCLLGPFAGVSLGGDGSFAAVCEGCPARPRCAGVDAGYLRRFAGDELSPRGLRPREGAPAPAHLFAGTGTLEQVETDMSQGTGVRVRLPVLRGGDGL